MGSVGAAFLEETAMKCMHVTSAGVFAGLPIFWEHNQPFVRVGNKNFYLSEDVYRVNPLRLGQCDLTLHEGKVGLAIEGVAGSFAAHDDARLFAIDLRDFETAPECWIEETSSDSKSSIIYSTTYRSIAPGSSGMCHHGLLAVLYPGAVVLCKSSTEVVLPKPSGLLGLLLPTRYDNVFETREAARYSH
jgi:hypothetical protein